uniref:Uncharacterized protein n=1 Tax=Elaeophora elaphi TaxID=1147741 RepID=A0A0R3RJN7_9BILA
MGFISNTIFGYNTRKTIRSSSLSFINKHRSLLPLSSQQSLPPLSSSSSSSSSSSVTYLRQFQTIKITDCNNSNTGSITQNVLQQSDDNVCSDERLPAQSYRHSTFRPYPIPQEDENSFRPCRSHESLLAYSSAHMIDLGL